MNERIKELIKEAGIIQPERFDAVNGSKQLEKFAELIVKECLGIVEPDVGMSCGDEWYATLCCAAQEIKLHFGVKE